MQDAIINDAGSLAKSSADWHLRTDFIPIGLNILMFEMDL
jgi:hypothetical protein